MPDAGSAGRNSKSLALSPLRPIRWPRKTKFLPSPIFTIAGFGPQADGLRIADPCIILVSMIRIRKTKAGQRRPPSRRGAARQPGHWRLQDAKARFSELVRRVRSEGPQHVTVHGRDEVVVVAAEEFRRLKGDQTGQALVAAMAASPHRDVEIEPARGRMPARDVVL